MDEIERMMEAMHRKKDAKTCNRITTVRAVLLGRSTSDAASIIGVERRTVQMWMNGTGNRALAVSATPHAWAAGRRRRSRVKLRRLYMKNMLTPKKLRRWVRNRLNVTHRAESVRRISEAWAFRAVRP